VTAFFAGAIADRHDRGALMRAVNLASLLAAAAIAAVLTLAPSGHVHLPGPAGFYLPVWVLLAYPCWAAVTVTSTLFRPAFNTSIPRVVPAGSLGRANGVIYATAALLSAGGTLAAGALLTVLPVIWALTLPFVLFFGTQVALTAVDASLAVARTSPPRSVWAEAREGYGYLWKRRELFEITLSALVVNFFAAVALVELALYVASWLGLVQGIWYGAMVSTATLGGATGLVLISRFRFEPHAGPVMIGLTLSVGLAILALGLAHSIWLALPIVFIYGMIPGMITTVFLSTIQATVPDAMMGRVFAADEVGSYALVPVGQYTGGLVTVAIGVQGTYLAAGAAIATFGCVMVVGFRALRHLGYRSHAHDPRVPPAEG
jgi:MFS family permease